VGNLFRRNAVKPKRKTPVLARADSVRFKSWYLAKQNKARRAALAES
jgi:hypothetical protein